MDYIVHIGIVFAVVVQRGQALECFSCVDIGISTLLGDGHVDTSCRSPDQFNMVIAVCGDGEVCGMVEGDVTGVLGTVNAQMRGCLPDPGTSLSDVMGLNSGCREFRSTDQTLVTSALQASLEVSNVQGKACFCHNDYCVAGQCVGLKVAGKCLVWYMCVAVGVTIFVLSVVMISCCCCRCKRKPAILRIPAFPTVNQYIFRSASATPFIPLEEERGQPQLIDGTLVM